MRSPLPWSRTTGLWALENAELFNILCVPPLARGVDIGAPTRDAAAALAKARRAMYVMDAPAEWTVAEAVAVISGWPTPQADVVYGDRTVGDVATAAFFLPDVGSA